MSNIHERTACFYVCLLNLALSFPRRQIVFVCVIAGLFRVSLLASTVTQPAKKKARRQARQEKAAKMAPRPTQLLRPAVHCPTVKVRRVRIVFSGVIMYSSHIFGPVCSGLWSRITVGIGAKSLLLGALGGTRGPNQFGLSKVLLFQRAALLMQLRRHRTR